MGKRSYCITLMRITTKTSEYIVLMRICGNGRNGFEYNFIWGKTCPRFHGTYPWAIFNSTCSTAMNICIKLVYYYADHQTKGTDLWAFSSMHISKTQNRVVLYTGVNKKTKDLCLYHRLSSAGESNYLSNWADQSSY